MSPPKESTCFTSFNSLVCKADHERAERQRHYLAGLAEEAEYETSEATSLATSSTMEGEHMIERREDEEAGSDTPQGCLSPDTELQSDTPTPTPTHGTKASHNNVDRIREQVTHLHAF